MNRYLVSVSLYVDGNSEDEALDSVEKLLNPSLDKYGTGTALSDYSFGSILYLGKHPGDPTDD